MAANKVTPKTNEIIEKWLFLTCQCWLHSVFLQHFKVYVSCLVVAYLSKNNLRKIAVIFLSISLNICFGFFGFSKEPSHQDGDFEYQQHMFWLRNKKKNLRKIAIIFLSIS